MSIPQWVPHFILKCKREDGLFDWAVFNPRGWVGADLLAKSHSGARDDEQIIGRAQEWLRPDQDDVEIKEVTRAEFCRAVLPAEEGGKS